MNWTAQHRTAASDLERLSAARWLGYWRLGGGAIGDAAAVGHRLSAPSAIGGLAVGGLAVGGHWQLGYWRRGGSGYRRLGHWRLGYWRLGYWRGRRAAVHKPQRGESRCSAQATDKGRQHRAIHSG